MAIQSRINGLSSGLYVDFGLIIQRFANQWRLGSGSILAIVSNLRPAPLSLAIRTVERPFDGRIQSRTPG